MALMDQLDEISQKSVLEGLAYLQAGGSEATYEEAIQFCLDLGLMLTYKSVGHSVENTEARLLQAKRRESCSGPLEETLFLEGKESLIERAIVDGRLENMRQITKPSKKLDFFYIVAGVSDDYAEAEVFGIFTDQNEADNLVYDLWDEMNPFYCPSAMVKEVPLNIDLFGAKAG